MTKILETDDDGSPFLPESDPLELLLRRATAATAADRRLKQARKRLASISGSGHPAEAGESQRLLWEIRRLEEGRVWITVARLAVFDTQVCDTCGSRHEFFRGWMLEQRHTGDKTARKLVAHAPADGQPKLLPERREDHAAAHVDVCGNCVESQIAINIASGQSVEAA